MREKFGIDRWKYRFLCFSTHQSNNVQLHVHCWKTRENLVVVPESHRPFISRGVPPKIWFHNLHGIGGTTFLLGSSFTRLFLKISIPAMIADISAKLRLLFSFSRGECNWSWHEVSDLHFLELHKSRWWENNRWRFFGPFWGGGN